LDDASGSTGGGDADKGFADTFRGIHSLDVGDLVVGVDTTVHRRAETTLTSPGEVHPTGEGRARGRGRRRVGSRLLLVVFLVVVSACEATATSTTSARSTTTVRAVETATTAAATLTTPSTTAAPAATPALPGMPPVVVADRIYSETAPNAMSPAVTGARALVYVPSNDDGSVTVIDQATFAVVDRYRVGKLVQHVVPAWDLTTLYANASGSNQLVPIDPTTGKRGTAVRVDAPYNLYFTPDGTKAVVMAERKNRIDYYDPHTWKRLQSVDAPCDGVNHADWSADGRWFLVSCEFSGQLLKVDTVTGTVVGVVALEAGSMPQDVRLAPDGSKFYVADMAKGVVWVVAANDTRVIGSITTGVGAHGIYPSRDGTRMYVSNRGRLMGDEGRRSRPGEGSVSVIDAAIDRVVATWLIPGGGSPDMGGVSADGRLLWLSGRYDSQVYVFDTTTGLLAARINVPSGPHGLCLFPQPGRYSLGHTGNYR
jgi:DNA-binding beta-propeller fold protein YncE